MSYFEEFGNDNFIALKSHLIALDNSMKMIEGTTIAARGFNVKRAFDHIIENIFQFLAERRNDTAPIFPEISMIIHGDHRQMDSDDRQRVQIKIDFDDCEAIKELAETIERGWGFTEGGEPKSKERKIVPIAEALYWLLHHRWEETPKG